jgi:ABC-2 type transport system ATP-binding protein
VEGLKKTFRVPKKKEHNTFSEKMKGLFYREWEEIEVLKGLDFSIQEGEFIGYIGANGAGKSTTIKILTGILCPDGGRVRCAGFNPYHQRYAYTYNIGVVFGQKSILEYEVPVVASFELYRRIYEMDETVFKKRIDFFHEILSIKELMHVPVRKLSFGQRMRCEVAASLLHQPKIVFLDEPTIGLDASAKKEIREFLKTVNQMDKTTIILTTHDMKDIESLCHRVLMINKGELIYDGELEQLKKSYLREKTLHFNLESIQDESRFEALKQMCKRVQVKGAGETWTLASEDINLSDFMRSLLAAATFVDFSVTEPELEDVVDHIYDQSRGVSVK